VRPSTLASSGPGAPATAPTPSAAASRSPSAAVIVVGSRLVVPWRAWKRASARTSPSPRIASAAAAAVDVEVDEARQNQRTRVDIDRTAVVSRFAERLHGVDVLAKAETAEHDALGCHDPADEVGQGPAPALCRGR
jgi:hypothetical protein